MNILVYVLVLVITCMILVPFIGFSVSIACDIYFKHKLKFVSAIANAMVDSIDQTVDKIKEKVNEG